MSLISQSADHDTSYLVLLLTMQLILKKASLNVMSHTAVTILSTLRLLLARTTPGPQRSRAESRRLLRTTTPGTGLVYWPVTPGIEPGQAA